MKKALVAILVLLLVAGGVGWFIAPAMIPQVSIQNVVIEFTNSDTVTILVNLKIHNRLKIPITYLKATYRIVSGDSKIAAGEFDLSGEVLAKGDCTLALPMKVDVAKVRETGKVLAPTISGELYCDLKVKNWKLKFRGTTEDGATITSESEESDVFEVEGDQ